MDVSDREWRDRLSDPAADEVVLVGGIQRQYGTDVGGFMPPSLMGDTAAAAMSFLGSTRALIIDLRQNGGGSPDGVALIASYLFNHPVRMNDIYDRPSNETRQFWTLPSSQESASQERTSTS